MTFMHMDATTAAAAVGNIVGFTWEDSEPYSSINLDDGGDGFWGLSTLEIFGEGTASPGTYEGEEHEFNIFTEEWINPAFSATIDQYFHRSIDVHPSTDGSIPGSQQFDSAWTEGRTEWRSFASSSPYTNMTADATASWAAEAAGAYGSSFYEEYVDCTVQIGRLIGLVETFEFTNVDIGADEIVLVGHGFNTGDAVVYTAGGAVPTPLEDDELYYVHRVSNDRISLANNLSGVGDTPSLINITFSGTGTGHTFQRIDAEASVAITLDAST